MSRTRLQHPTGIHGYNPKLAYKDAAPNSHKNVQLQTCIHGCNSILAYKGASPNQHTRGQLQTLIRKWNSNLAYQSAFPNWDTKDAAPKLFQRRGSTRGWVGVARSLYGRPGKHCSRFLLRAKDQMLATPVQTWTMTMDVSAWRPAFACTPRWLPKAPHKVSHKVPHKVRW